MLCGLLADAYFGLAGFVQIQVGLNFSLEVDMLKADFHLHSSFSGDSDTAPEQIVETGLLKGLSAVCFTDHFDADYPYDNVCFMLDTEAYLERVLELRSAYEGRIEIGFGVELGLQPHLGELYRSYVGQYPFDFVIGSTHLMDGKDPYYASFWEDCAPKDGIRRFLEITLENMKAFDDFDVYGHLDYIVRYAPLEPKRFFYGDYGDLMDEILRFLISHGKGIEVNTGGYKAGLGCPNPCPEVLRRYRELGGEIVTMGSDAHAAEYVGGFMDAARDVLRDCGFRYFTVFRGREAVFVALD